MTTNIEETWQRDGDPHVRVGDVVDATGRALDVQRLLMRRWGWPKKAAKRAAEWFDEHHPDTTGFMLPVMGPARLDLQQRLLDGIPDLLADLMEGVANRAQREVKDSHRAVTAIEVNFVQDSAAGRVPTAISDEGVVTSVMHVVAGRLGISIDEMRERCDFERRGAVVVMTVFVDPD